MADNSILTLAHKNGRIADKNLKKKAFDEAIGYHQKALDYLQEAVQLTTFPQTVESLELQKTHHLGQTEIIRAQKLQFAIRQQIAQIRKKKMEKKKHEEDQKDQDLEWTVLRSLEEADNLLGELLRNNEVNTNEDEVNALHISHDSSQILHPHTFSTGYRKITKGNRIITEELKKLNSDLKVNILRLVDQLHASQQEVEFLRSRLKLYEKQKLPELAPLELPNFDFPLN